MAAAAIIGGAAIGGVATAWGASQAAGAQESAAQSAQQTQMQMFNVAQGNLAPYMQLGKSALPMYNALLGIGGPGGGTPGAPNTQQMMTALQNMPGYQFTNYYGQQAVQNGMAARGLGSSGAALAAGAQFATGLANQNYQTYLGDLAGAVGTGENAAAGVGQLATTTGSNVAQEQMAGGAAAAAGYNGIASGVNNAVQGGIQGYLGMSYLNQLTGQTAGAGATATATNPYLPYAPMPSYLTGNGGY